MSYWIHDLKCKKCGVVIKVAGGVIGTQVQGPSNDQLTCVCGEKGYSSFENLSLPANWPRRSQMQQWSSAEYAISHAMGEVEKMGADYRLTDAVVLLGKAKDAVANFIDGVE